MAALKSIRETIGGLDYETPHDRRLVETIESLVDEALREIEK